MSVKPANLTLSVSELMSRQRTSKSICLWNWQTSCSRD